MSLVKKPIIAVADLQLKIQIHFWNRAPLISDSNK